MKNEEKGRVEKMSDKKMKNPCPEQEKACPERGIMALMSKQSSSDVLGSYTGTPYAEDDEPVQDADDL